MRKDRNMTRRTIQRISSLLITNAVLIAAFTSVSAMNGQATIAIAKPARFAPIPTGLPNYFGYGLFNGSISDMHSGVPYNYRYQYLSGGVNTGDGWQNWQADGRYAVSYVTASRQAGYIPGFVYFNISQ